MRMCAGHRGFGGPLGTEVQQARFLVVDETLIWPCDLSHRDGRSIESEIIHSGTE
jgi:hypothetical protein